MLNYSDTEQPAAQSYTFWPPRHPLPTCSGSCQDGHLPCQTPNACYLPDESADQVPASPNYTRGILTFLGVACFAVACAVARALGWA